MAKSSKGTVVKAVPTPAKKKMSISDDSSDSSDSEPTSNSGDSSSSEDSSSESDASDKPTVPTKITPVTAPNNVDSASSSDDSSDATSSSEESSSGSDSNEEEDKKTPPPIQTAPPEVNKKRKPDSEIASSPKKTKLTDTDNVATSGEETKSIFVGKLSWNVDNDWLAQEFAECGEVESAYVQMDRNTGRSRGFGYVHFKTADAVEKALALDGTEIDGRPVKIDRSTQPDKKVSAEKRARAFGDTLSPPSAVLFVGNLSFSVNEETLWETFGEHGDIKSVRVPTDRETGKPKGFAYVEFSEVQCAKKAHGALQGYEFDGRSIRLDFSQPRDSAGGRGGGLGGRGGRGRGGFGGDRGRGGARGVRGGDRGGRGRGRGARTGGIAQFQGQKITF